MKILYIHNDYAAPTGEEHAAQAIVDLLHQKGHCVEWYRRSSLEITGSLAGSVKAFATGIYNPLTVARVGRVLKSFQPDIVQIQNIYPLISASVFRAVKAHGVPVVMRCPNYRLFCPNGLFFDLQGRVCERCLGPGKEFWALWKNCLGTRFKSAGYALRGAMARQCRLILDFVDVFLVQTEFQRLKFINNGIPKDKIVVVPGLSPEVKLPEKIPGGEFVSFVGRVSPEKGIEEFLEAAEQLPDIPFAVAGDISIPGIRKRASANVLWKGFLSGEKLTRFFLDSRIIIVPSKWYEGFPNVLTRAMRFAKPVIASDIGAMQSIVQDGVTGLKFSPGDVDDLISKIRELYRDVDKCQKMGQAGARVAESLYSKENIYEALMVAYEKAYRYGEYAGV